MKTLPNQKASESAIAATASANSTDLLESIKAHLLAGRTVRVIDFPAERRREVVGTLAQLCDEFPIRSGWQTIRQSHLSETRLRARRYSIPGEFLRGDE